LLSLNFFWALKIKPIYIAYYFLGVLGVLFGLLFLSSKSEKGNLELPKEEGFNIAGLFIKYPNAQSFFSSQVDSTQLEESIDKMVASITPLDDTTKVVVDSTSAIDSAKKKVVIPNLSKIDYKTLVRIRYPKQDTSFTADLHSAFMSKKCRILHYGDSQIEGDRITAYLRNRLQKMYAGGGPGFIPIKQVYHQISAEVSCSDNWLRYALFDPSNYKKTPHKKYGAFLSLSRFTPMLAKDDSTDLDSLPTSKANIVIGKSKRYYRKLKDFTHVGLHYGNVKSPTSIKCYNEGILIKSDSLKKDTLYHEFSLDLPKTPDSLRIVLESKISPDFYGLTLEKSSGIQMDNIAMRGNSGTVFTKNSWQNFSRMGRHLNPKVVILQFGGNTVPYMKDSSRVRWYAKNLARQFDRIRSTLGKNIKILFLGPTDLCTSVNGEMVTYPILPYLNEQLEKKCLENKVAYWSVFDAMGGEGSMAVWAEKGLVADDFVHFSSSGTKIISELFFTTLYLDLKPHITNETL